MRAWMVIALATLALGGCITTEPSPTVVVPAGATVVCPNGTTVSPGSSTRC